MSIEVGPMIQHAVPSVTMPTSEDDLVRRLDELSVEAKRAQEAAHRLVRERNDVIRQLYALGHKTGWLARRAGIQPGLTSRIANGHGDR